MNKRLLIVLGLLLLVMVIVVFIFGKISPSLKVKEGKISSSSGLIIQAQELEKKGDLQNAKLIYQKLVGELPNSRQIIEWQKKIDGINIKLLFSSTVTPGSVLYEIKPGDTLVKIAKEFKTTTELIMKSNNLASDKIMPGRKIKVWNTPFSILVDKSQNTLVLKTEDEIIKTYIVSTGASNCTPIGNFKIINKLPNPTWFKSGAVIPANSPGNILGSRWLGFDLPGYGIHGTVEPQNLGSQVTQGCVRMSNSEVEELYTSVPVGTEVTIID